MVIDTLLKKAGLDSKIYKNYQPVINLLFLSKLTERIVKRRIDSHIEAITRKHLAIRQDIALRR